MSYKVCYVTTLPGTLESFVLKSALYNIEHGEWEVTFICNREEDFPKRLPDCIRYIPVDMPRGINLYGLKAIPSLYRIFKKERFDLVQYATANAGLYASIAARMAHIPIRLYTLWGLGYVRLSGIRRLYKEKIERIICKCSTHIQPDSKENLKIALEQKLFSPEQGEVIGYGSAVGVDLNKFDISKKELWNAEIRRKHQIPMDAFVVGYVGMMLRDKGINELLAAAGRLIDERDDIYFLLVGGHEIVEGISPQQWDWAKKEERVILAGRRGDVEKYYAAMDCFTLPSYHEGFGMVTIEAEAMGLPIIDTNIPGSREAMKDGETGMLIPVGDSNALYEAINKFCCNRDLMLKYGSSARKYAEDRFEQQQLLSEIFENRMSLLETAYGKTKDISNNGDL